MVMFEIKNNLKKANVPRTVRFTDELNEELNKLAVDNGISFHSLVLQCCKYALDNLNPNNEH